MLGVTFIGLLFVSKGKKTEIRLKHWFGLFFLLLSAAAEWHLFLTIFGFAIEEFVSQVEKPLAIVLSYLTQMPLRELLAKLSEFWNPNPGDIVEKVIALIMLPFLPVAVVFGFSYSFFTFVLPTLGLVLARTTVLAELEYWGRLRRP